MGCLHHVYRTLPVPGKVINRRIYIYDRHDVCIQDTPELPGYGEESEPKEPAKRKAGSYKGAAAKPRYNNWFGRANDWSRKIQRVQGRIRFKNQYFK